MRVLVIGSGGREDALVSALWQSRQIEKIYCAPGNAGTARIAKNKKIAAGNIPALKRLVKREKIGLTIVGPEDPLVAGIVDKFEADNLPIIGPTKAAARLEGSKVWAREFAVRHHIPAPGFKVFNWQETSKAYGYIAQKNIFPTVIKVDGLAAGKGVMVCRSFGEVEAALKRIAQREFGQAGEIFLVEDFLFGEEASYIVLVDKNGNSLPLASSQDHKSIHDGDEGPNTGGMGAYSPAPVVTPEVEERIIKRIVRPTIEGMRQEGTPFYGILYVGLMIDHDGNPSVVEFNVRFGDPETQPILARMKTDLLGVFIAMAEGRLDTIKIEWDKRPAVSVVKASKGYPGKYKKGFVIKGIPKAEARGAIVNHAGTKLGPGGRVFTNGGRVVTITALGEDHADAISKAYKYAAEIFFINQYYRTNIGHRALNR